MKDPLLKPVTKQHRYWLSGIHASTYGGRTMSLEQFGITTRRLEILESMGLVDFKDGKYLISERGQKYLIK